MSFRPRVLNVLTPLLRWALRRLLRRLLKQAHGRELEKCTASQRIQVARDILGSVQQELAEACKVHQETLNR